MGFFDLFKQPDINQGVKDYQAVPGAILLDVRTPQEYREGHIPGSKNVPLQTIDKVASVAENKDDYTELCGFQIDMTCDNRQIGFICQMCFSKYRLELQQRVNSTEISSSVQMVKRCEKFFQAISDDF